MSLRVAFDMDGTIADMDSVLRREAARLFGDDAQGPVADGVATPEATAAAPPSDAPPLAAAAERALNHQQEARLWAHVRRIEDFWTTLPELEPGVVARLAEVAQGRRWEVLFITTRPSSAGDTTQRQTQRWLEAHGFRMPSVVVVQRSRGKMADALHLDVVVDDRPENCLDVALDSQARALLIWPGDKAQVPAGLTSMGVRPVASASEALTVIERLDDRRGQSRVVRSLRKMLSMDDLDLP